MTANRFSTFGSLTVSTLFVLGALSGTPRANAQFSFDPPESYFTGSTTSFLAPADFDGDGHIDLAHALADGSVTVLFNRGDGTYDDTAPQIYQVAPSLRAFIAADLDGDGDHDLIATRAGAFPVGKGVVSVLLNNGAGIFTEPALEFDVLGTSVANQQLTPLALTVSDLDGDGDPDLAAATTLLNVVGQPGFFSVVLNETPAAGPLTLADSVNISSIQTKSSAIVAGDFDNDQDMDLAVANVGDDSISVFLNDGGGISGPVAKENLSGDVAQPFHIIAGDVNGDTFADLITLNQFHSYTVLLNLDGGIDPTDAGTFKDQGQSPVGDQGLPAMDLPIGADLGDFDFDGDLDLAVGLVGDGGPGSLVVLPNPGSGIFGVGTAFGIGLDYTFVKVLDPAGARDLMATNGLGNTVSVLRNTLAPTLEEIFSDGFESGDLSAWQ